MTYPHPACMEPDGGEGPCRGYIALNEALEAHKIMLSEAMQREGALLNALHEIADYDKHGGYNTACGRARKAIAVNIHISAHTAFAGI